MVHRKVEQPSVLGDKGFEYDVTNLLQATNAATMKDALLSSSSFGSVAKASVIQLAYSSRLSNWSLRNISCRSLTKNSQQRLQTAP